VLISQGSILGGWSLFKRGNTLTYVHNYAHWREYRLSAAVVLDPGPHTLGFRFRQTTATGGVGALVCDGGVRQRAGFARVTPIRFSLTGAGLWCGRGGNLAVCDDYEGPFPWSGTLDRVVIQVAGLPHIDAAATADAVLQVQ